MRKPISSMPGVFNLSVDEALKEAEECAALGIGGLLLFGLPAEKDEQATGAWADDGIVQTALRAIKQNRKLDIAGADRRCLPVRVHLARPLRRRRTRWRSLSRSRTIPASRIAREDRGVARKGRRGYRRAQRHDGRPRRRDARWLSTLPALSRHADHELCRRSSPRAFYGPFREAADSAPQFGDRRSYQMDGANLREAMREIDQDLAEGADMLLMKPAMPYLDVVREARERYDVPIGAYQVSGEYSMLHAAFERGWLEPRTRHDGVAAGHPPRRRRLYRDLLCEGCGEGAGLED